MIYLYLFLEFFKIGLFTFGGGYAMIPLVKETVLKYGWLTEEAFYNLIGVCESTPGPIAINMATYVGSIQGGLLGSVVATLGVVLPSFIIILLIATVLTKLMNNKYFSSFMNGIKPVVIGLLLSTGMLLLVKALGYNGNKEFTFDIKGLVIFALISGIYFGSKLLFKKKLNAVTLIIISACLGIVTCLII
jgi:chromate transporter